MIEQLLEKNVVDRIDLLFKDIASRQITGSLQTCYPLKGVDTPRDVYVYVSAQPRSYDSPTVPTCQIQIQVALSVYAGTDFTGKNYIELMDRLLGQFETWQKCLDDAHRDFTVEGFQLGGFQLGDGRTQLNSDMKLWTYTHGMTIFGVINNKE